YLLRRCPGGGRLFLSRRRSSAGSVPRQVRRVRFSRRLVLNDTYVELQQQIGDAAPRVEGGGAPRALRPEPYSQVGVIEKLPNRGGDAVRVTRRDGQACFVVDDKATETAYRRPDNGYATGHGLERDHSEGLVPGDTGHDVG